MPFFVHQTLSSLEPLHEIIIFLCLLFVQNVTNAWILIRICFDYEIFLFNDLWLLDVDKIKVRIVIVYLITNNRIICIVILNIDLLYFLYAFITHPIWTRFYILVFCISQCLLSILPFSSDISILIWIHCLCCKMVIHLSLLLSHIYLYLKCEFIIY